MSPEHRSINNVGKNVRRELKAKMEEQGLKYETLVYTGFGFNYNGKLNSIVQINELTEGQKRDAQKPTSTWHVVQGIEGDFDSSRLKAFWKGHSKKYRGNHRSHTKGPGARAIFKNLKYNNKE